MAAYASTVTIKFNVRVPFTPYRFLGGVIDITNYNSTTIAETDITKYFKASSATGYTKGILGMVLAPSDNGYLYRFIVDTGKFYAYQFNYAQTTAADGPMIELSNDVDGGAAYFLCWGITA